MSYYYLMPSLPHLFPDSSPPFSGEKFLKICEKQMPCSDFEQLKSVKLSQHSDDCKCDNVFKKWSFWETSLRNELARLRAEKLGIDFQPFLRKSNLGRQSHLTILCKNIFSMSPLNAEKALNMARWKELDMMGSNNYFSLSGVIIYFIKLQLLEKISLFNQEKGTACVSEIVAKAENIEFREYDESE